MTCLNFVGTGSRISLHAVSSCRRVKPSRKIALNSNGEVNYRELAWRPWATRECRSRSMRINVESQNTPCLHTENCRSTSASVWRRNTNAVCINVRQYLGIWYLCVHTRSYLRSVNLDWYGFRESTLNCIDLDLHSCVGSPSIKCNIFYFKDRQMGHYVMVSLWCDFLLTNTRFRFLYFRVNNC